MRRKLQRFVGLIAAAALCAAIPAGAAAAEPNVLWDFRQEFDSAIAEPVEITTFDTGDDGTAVVTDGTDTTVENTGYYTVTIPSTVSVTSTDAAGKPTAGFTLSGTVAPYRKLTIEVSSTNDDKLVCGNSALAYNLSATSNSLTIDNTDKKYSLETDADQKNFSADLAVNVTGTPTVSGEYSDTLTFTMECQKVTQSYTINAEKQTLNGSTSESKTKELTPGEKLTLKDLYDLGIIGNSDGDNDGRWEYRWEEPNVTVPTDPSQPLNITLKRRNVYLNLNALYYDADTNRYVKSTSLVTEDGKGKIMAYVNLEINGTQTGLDDSSGTTHYDLVDYATAHPYGTSFKFYNIQVQPGYKLIGYFYNQDNDSEIVGPETKEEVEARKGYTKLATVDTITTIEGELEGYVRYVEERQLMQTLYLVFEPTSTNTTTTQTLSLTDDGTTMMDSMRVSMESQLADLTGDAAEPTPDDTADTTTDAPSSPAPADEYVAEDYPVVFFETSIGNGDGE